MLEDKLLGNQHGVQSHFEAGFGVGRAGVSGAYNNTVLRLERRFRARSVHGTHLLPFPLHRDGKQLVRAFQPRHASRSVVKKLLKHFGHKDKSHIAR